MDCAMLMGEKFWRSEESCLLVNPKIPEDVQASIREAVVKQPQESSVWLLSSGTESSTTGRKVVCLEKKAILAAAQSVVNYFQIDEKDVWACSIPKFHIGGVSIYARCFLAGAKVEDYDGWDPSEFTSFVESKGVTIASLVPTQVFDLVSQNIQAPKSLRFVLVGGGALKKDLYQKARNLGWPLIPSYGMTETSAMMAGASLESLEKSEFPQAKVLEHLHFNKVGEKYSVESKALYSGFLLLKEDVEPQWVERPTPFVLDDRIEISEEGVIKVLGRESELIKILGESVNVVALENKISTMISEEVILLPIPNERKGFDLLLGMNKELSRESFDELNSKLLPYERISKIYVSSHWPRNEMGKIQKNRIIESLKESHQL